MFEPHDLGQQKLRPQARSESFGHLGLECPRIRSFASELDGSKSYDKRHFDGLSWEPPAGER